MQNNSWIQAKWALIVPLVLHSPFKVVKTSLVDASGVSSLLFTSECCIVDAPEEKGPAGAGGVSTLSDGDRDHCTDCDVNRWAEWAEECQVWAFKRGDRQYVAPHWSSLKSFHHVSSGMKQSAIRGLSTSKFPRSHVSRLTQQQHALFSLSESTAASSSLFSFFVVRFALIRRKEAVMEISPLYYK